MNLQLRIYSNFANSSNYSFYVIQVKSISLLIKDTASIYSVDILSHPYPFDSLPDIEKRGRRRRQKENKAMSLQI